MSPGQAKDLTPSALSVYRAFIIEDDEGWAKSIGALLEENGFKVDYDPDIARAVEQAKRGSYDLVVVDKQLEWTETGVQVIDAIRAVDSRVCLVLATAHPRSPEEEAILTACNALKCDKEALWQTQMREAAVFVLRSTSPRVRRDKGQSAVGTELARRLKSTFLDYLDSYPDEDIPTLAYGDRVFSIVELRSEVENETDLGVLLVELFLKERLLS